MVSCMCRFWGRITPFALCRTLLLDFSLQPMAQMELPYKTNDWRGSRDPYFGFVVCSGMLDNDKELRVVSVKIPCAPLALNIGTHRTLAVTRTGS